MRRFPLLRSALAAVLLAAAPAAGQPSFTLRFDPAQQAGPYTGRVYVVLLPRATASGPEPRLGINNWFRPPQVLSLDVTAVPPGGTVEINAATPGLKSFPKPLAELTEGSFAAQAVARRSLDHPVPGQGPGDLYSSVGLVSAKPPEADAAAAPAQTIELKLASVVLPRPFTETDRVKLVEIVSPRLRQHHGRDVKLRAAVVLPAGWSSEGTTTYPAVYFITGFGGDHRSVNRSVTMLGETASKVLFVVPDPSCFWGHSVFADSPTNGPWATALVEELIPEIERRFRGPAADAGGGGGAGGGGSRRYVFGVSSGGWSSLWLQINHPDAFAGCWAHVPDPVDFRDFQRINLYRAGENMFKDQAGQRRPLARMGDRVALYYDTFVAMEDTLGPGGQIASFEAVFSPRLPDGRPRPLFDRATGAVDAETAKAWEAYDIRLVLERRWPELGPKLAGKLHVYAGEMDTFYLEGAVSHLKESLGKLNSDAEVVIVPGMAHSPYSKGLRAMCDAIMAREAAPAPAK